MKKILTGITTTGTPHLGNYVGAIRPAIKLSKEENNKSYLWLANYHSLIKCHEPKIIKESTLEIAATWLACGLNPEKVLFYRQSDIPEILELNWILNCNCAKGLINRAHAYKAAVQDNINTNNDQDHNIEMGLYCYPILMAADILMFNVDFVPVGRDQLQHLEMTRDIAARFNSRYKKLFKMPEAIVDENEILIGLDGRKMSKSYANTIPLFCEENKLKKVIMKIVTNSKEPGEPKDTSDSNLFKIYKSFASKDEIKNMEKEYENGIAWGEVKNILFNKINEELAPLREKYLYYKNNQNLIEEILQEGAKKARKEASPFLKEIKKAVGITNLI